MQAEALSRLTPDTTLTVRRHLRHVLRQEPDHVALVLGDRTLRLPPASADTVTTLLDGTPLRIDQFPDLDPTDAASTLARRLVREGVAVPADHARSITGA